MIRAVWTGLGCDRLQCGIAVHGFQTIMAQVLARAGAIESPQSVELRVISRQCERRYSGRQICHDEVSGSIGNARAA
jgi:hypothetical protein